MTRRLLALLCGVALLTGTGCSGGSDDDAAPASTEGRADGVEELAESEPAVAGLRTTFEGSLTASPGSEVSGVLAAFRGSQRAFAEAGCPSLAATDEVVVVVYLRGRFTSPSGRPTNAALVSQHASSPSATAALFVDDPEPSPTTWCRAPGGG